MRSHFAIVVQLATAETPLEGVGLSIPNQLSAPSDHVSYDMVGDAVSLNHKFGEEGTTGDLKAMINKMEAKKAGAAAWDTGTDYTVEEVEHLSDMVNEAKGKASEEAAKAEYDKEMAQETMAKTNEIEQRQAEVLGTNNALGGLFNTVAQAYNAHVFTKNQLEAETKQSGLLQTYLASNQGDIAGAVAGSKQVIDDIGGLIEEVDKLGDDSADQQRTIGDLFDWDEDVTTNVNRLVTGARDLAERIEELQVALQASLDQTTTLNGKLADLLANSKAPAVGSSTVEEEEAAQTAKQIAESSLIQVNGSGHLLNKHPDYHSWGFGQKFELLFKQLRQKASHGVIRGEEAVQSAEDSTRHAVESLEKRITMFSRVMKNAMAVLPKEPLLPISHA